MTKNDEQKIKRSLINANENFINISKKLKFIDIQLFVLELAILVLLILKCI